MNHKRMLEGGNMKIHKKWRNMKEGVLDLQQIEGTSSM
jgi:hypothetical protein